MRLTLKHEIGEKTFEAIYEADVEMNMHDVADYMAERIAEFCSKHNLKTCEFKMEGVGNFGEKARTLGALFG